MKFIQYIILLMTKMFPLRSKIVFSSFNGHYSDSPKAISETLHKLKPDIRIIWLIDYSRRCELPSYVKGIDINDYRAVFHISTAAVYVNNNFGRKGIFVTSHSKSMLISKFLIWLNSKKGQLNLTTWHGTPLKKIASDQPSSNSIDFLTPELVITHPNIHTMKVMDRITFGKATNVLLGLPRNDVLFDEALSINNKKKINILPDQKVVLYAPTFRSDGYDTENKNIQKSGINQLSEINFELLFETLSNKFGGNSWVFVGRFHYFVENEIDWEELERKYYGKIINGNIFDDMRDYLTIADVLITDCSSCMFDFALTKKPCFLFFPDIDHYKNKERGFYFDIEELPFECSKSFKGLLKNIVAFDNDVYFEKVTCFNRRINVVDTGKSSENVVKFILDHSRI